ncbi:hypothetical protein [Desulfovibrio sp. TomC]|uniref:hypothetical protein n=1 Tax=Desulfovibrio sp. TomC TaxID=1562888 RepID=UPI000573136B|nr:hypothetical protein [Desulfovibrio sp. TomC]KHK03574.1 import inner membrane translocase, subunit Tim44 [Desulfovibrio sp. TomC]
MPNTPSALRRIPALAGLAASLIPVPAQAQTAQPASIASDGLLTNLILLGLAMFILFRFLSNRAKKKDSSQSPPPQQRYEDDDQTPPLDPTSPGKPNMYTNAQATWAALKSRPAPGSAPEAPSQGQPSAAPASSASSDDEFLAGAKLAYTRITTSLANRDYDDLTHFVSPSLLAQLRNSLPTSPAGKPEILLVDATLAEQNDTGQRTTMTVDYKALLRDPGASQNTERTERWTFARDNAAPGANWLLDGMERR